MSSPDKVAELRSQLDETLKRIDQAQKRKSIPLGTKLAGHLSKQRFHITNILLAGCVLSVAIGRLQQKALHEEEKQAWDERKQKLEADVDRWRGQAQHAMQQLTEFRAGVDKELSAGGWRLAPVADRLRSLLSAGTSASHGSSSSNHRPGQQQMTQESIVPGQASQGHGPKVPEQGSNPPSNGILPPPKKPMMI